MAHDLSRLLSSLRQLVAVTTEFGPQVVYGHEEHIEFLRRIFPGACRRQMQGNKYDDRQQQREKFHRSTSGVMAHGAYLFASAPLVSGDQNLDSSLASARPFPRATLSAPRAAP